MPLKIHTPIEPWQDFEDAYVSIRNKEGRILSDEELKSLPNISIGHPLQAEWALRQKSLDRVLKFIPPNSTVLELGCGNGWLSNELAHCGHSVLGIDVNQIELEQADRVFKKPNLRFAFADVFEWEPKEPFTVAIIASAVQYFQDPEKLLSRLFLVNKSLQKVIICDSPFYNSAEKLDATKRSAEYYDKKGVSNMKNNYHHHSLSDLGFKYSFLYSPPPKWLSKFWKFPPFPIVEIYRP